MSKLYKIESLLCNDIYYGCTTKKYLSDLIKIIKTVIFTTIFKKAQTKHI
jgi:hypothetical protein